MHIRTLLPLLSLLSFIAIADEQIAVAADALPISEQPLETPVSSDSSSIGISVQLEVVPEPVTVSEPEPALAPELESDLDSNLESRLESKEPLPEVTVVTEVKPLPGTVFSNEFVDDTQPRSRVIEALVMRINELRKKRQQLVDGTKIFNGIYATSDLTAELGGSEYGYALGLEWEIFDQGYYESKRDTAKTKIERELRYFQLLQQMLNRKLQEEIGYLHNLEAKIDLVSGRRLEQFSSEILSSLEIRLEQGLALQTEVDEWRYRKRSAKQTVEFHQLGKTASLSSESKVLLNRIERLKLKPIPELFLHAQERSIALKIQQTFIKMGQFFPDWKENLQVKLFVEQRKPYSGFSGSNNDSNQVAGVRVRLPIDFNRKRDAMIALDKQVYLEQEKAVRERLHQRITYASRHLGMEQNKLRHLIGKYELIGSKIELTERYREASIASLSYTPEKQLVVLALERMELSKTILKARISVLRSATELARLTLTDNVTELFLAE